MSRRRKTRFFLAHPKTIAAFGRECNARGVYPDPVVVEAAGDVAGAGYRSCPCDKIPISEANTSSILAMRIGEDDQGVIGLHPDRHARRGRARPSVRFIGINEKAIMSYLVSAYYSVAVLVPDALGVLEDVEL